MVGGDAEPDAADLAAGAAQFQQVLACCLDGMVVDDLSTVKISDAGEAQAIAQRVDPILVNIRFQLDLHFPRDRKFQSGGGGVNVFSLILTINGRIEVRFAFLPEQAGGSEQGMHLVPVSDVRTMILRRPEILQTGHIQQQPAFRGQKGHGVGADTDGCGGRIGKDVLADKGVGVIYIAFRRREQRQPVELRKMGADDPFPEILAVQGGEVFSKLINAIGQDQEEPVLIIVKRNDRVDRSQHAIILDFHILIKDGYKYRVVILAAVSEVAPAARDLMPGKEKASPVPGDGSKTLVSLSPINGEIDKVEITVKPRHKPILAAQFLPICRCEETFVLIVRNAPGDVNIIFAIYIPARTDGIGKQNAVVKGISVFIAGQQMQNPRTAVKKQTSPVMLSQTVIVIKFDLPPPRPCPRG